MKTLADFKRRLAIGVKLETKLYHIKDGQTLLARDYGVREVSLVQSKAFALATDRDGETVNSYCEYPKASNFKAIDNNTAKISFGFGYLIYTFV